MTVLDLFCCILQGKKVNVTKVNIKHVVVKLRIIEHFISENHRTFIFDDRKLFPIIKMYITWQTYRQKISGYHFFFFSTMFENLQKYICRVPCSFYILVKATFLQKERRTAYRGVQNDRNGAKTKKSMQMRKSLS